MSVNIENVKKYLLELQNSVCYTIEQEDGKVTFREDSWEHTEKGGGKTRVIENGPIIEQGGVNFSHVAGDRLPAAATAHRPELAGRRFQAMGLSSVIHPRNPFVPTAHMNVRCFVAEKENHDPIWWFGGGFDLTPYYGFEEELSAFSYNGKTGL